MVFHHEMQMTHTEPRSFDDFVERTEPKLRRALVARYGAEVGREATSDAVAYAWEHWDRVRTMANPAGYLYRVGQSSTRRWMRPRAHFPAVQDTGVPWIEPRLPAALKELSPRQREVVVLVHAFEYTLSDVAELIGLSRSTVQNHLERGLTKLRHHLEAAS